MVTPLAGLLWERQVEEVLLELGWEKYQIGNVCLFIENKDCFLSVYVDDIKMTGKKQNMASMWKKWMKNVDLDEPTSFLDHVYLGCTRRECKPKEIIIEEGCLDHVFLLEQLKNYQGWEKPHAKAVAWSHDVGGHAKKCVERDCELAYKKTEQLYTVSSPCLNDHRFNMEELESVEELSAVCSQIVLTCLYLARMVDQTSYGQ